jgi:hypothetical protein
MTEHMQRALEYIRNTGGKISVEIFDDDWEPIGACLRHDLLSEGLITVNDNFIEEVPKCL